MKIHKTLFLILLFLNIFLYFPFKKVIAYSNEQACSGCSESTNCNVNCNTGCGRCYCDSGQSNGGNGHYSCIDSQWCNWCNGHNSSSSSSQSSSSAAQICTEGQRVLNNNHYYWCKTDNSTGRNFWSWIGEKTTPCSSSGYFQCNENSLTYQSCTKADDEIAYYWSNYYNSRCQFDNCTVSSFRYNGDGSVDQCIQGHGPNTRIGWLSWKGYKNGPCLINTYQCDDRNHTMNYCKDNSSKWFNSDDPCSFTGYPAPPARPGGSSFSSSSSSRVSLPQDNVPPNPAKDVRVEFIHGNGTTIEDSIKFSWAWNGDRTCDGCEPAVEYCAFVKPTPGGPLITGYSTGRSTGPTPFPCNPDEFGPFWWQIVNESTGQVYKQFYSGAQNIQNIMKGLTINVLDNQGRLYPPGGTTYAVVCTDDESFNNRHDVFRIDIETRDARGKITGLQGSTYPNIKSIKASCCFSQAMGNADCNKNTDNSPIIDNSDFTIWKEEYLSTRLTKWSDFDTNSVVALKDFEIWRHNRYDPNP